MRCIHEVTRGGTNTVEVPDSLCPQPPDRAIQHCNFVDCEAEWVTGFWSKVLYCFLLVLYCVHISHTLLHNEFYEKRAGTVRRGDMSDLLITVYRPILTVDLMYR